MDIRREIESFTVDTGDRISQLPESITHHILSYLYSPKDLVRMSILSAYWFGIVASIPNLKLNFFTFEEVIKSSGIPFGTEKDIRDAFFKYVEYTISRFREQNVSVHTLNLNAPVSGPTEVDIINRCLESTIKKGVKVLVIGTVGYWPQVSYRVPDILLTSTSLTSLTLSYCDLPLSLMVDVVKFKCLKLLCLQYITLNEDVIKRFTTSCPLLEELVVRFCYGLKRFCVYGLLNLQQVEFCFRPEVERIDIDAPNLCFLLLNDGDIDETEVQPYMNLSSCKKLTKVCYHGKVLGDLSSNFPFLEDLFLVLPDECERLNVSSHSLRTFMLHSKCELDKIDVDAPNLQLFGFTDDLHVYSPKETILVPSKACIKWDCNDFITDHWFQELRQFLDKKIWFKELKLHIYVGSIVSIESEVIQWPPIEFEHVELEAEWFEYIQFYLLVVDSLLWCCRPQSLALIIDFSLLEFEEWESVVKRTYEKLLEQEDQARTNIHFVMSSSSSKDKMDFSDLSTLLKALPRDGSKQTITFIKSGSCLKSRKRKLL